MQKTVFLILLLTASQINFSQVCTIKGNAGTYAGEKLELFRYTDYIIKAKKRVANVPVDSQGYFSVDIETDKPFLIYFDLDVFVGKIVAEPGKVLNIVLPKKTVRYEEDELNPYFKPIEFYIRVLNDENSVNMGLRKFHDMYKDASKIIFKDPKHINSGTVEKEISKINEAVAQITDTFFKEYIDYKFLHLRALTYYKNKKAVLRKNFSSKEILYDNPAYNDLLEEQFGTFLFDEKADTLYKILVSNQNWNELDRFLAKNEMFYNKDFREYFLIMNLYKLFYKQPIYQKAILRIMQTAQGADINEHTRRSVSNFVKKSGNLVRGNYVKDFTLYDQYKDQKTLSEYKGKFVYLSFYTRDSYTCEQDEILLKELYEKKIKDLEIITVYKDHSHQNIIIHAQKNKYEWPVLHCYESDKILEDYNVIAYPTYYLINPEGKLLMLPAPGPAENFESEFFNVYQEWRRRQIRENN